MYTIFAADKQIPAERNSVPKTTGADAGRQNPYPTAMQLRRYDKLFRLRSLPGPKTAKRTKRTETT